MESKNMLLLASIHNMYVDTLTRDKEMTKIILSYNLKHTPECVQNVGSNFKLKNTPGNQWQGKMKLYIPILPILAYIREYIYHVTRYGKYVKYVIEYFTLKHSLEDGIFQQRAGIVTKYWKTEKHWWWKWRDKYVLKVQNMGFKTAPKTETETQEIWNMNLWPGSSCD